MEPFAIEHSKPVFAVDLALYACASVALAGLLIVYAPPWDWLEYAVLAVLGLVGWTAMEYLLHRYVLHGMRPFSGWHAEHHLRPGALISAPTILSASLIVLLVFLPAYALSDLQSAGAFTWGVLTGYLAYSITHHAVHHWPAGNAWVRRPQGWHALHHQHQHAHYGQPGPFGVTTVFWDHLFGSYPEPGVVFQRVRLSRSRRYHRV